MAQVTIEFYGIVRRRTGRTDLVVSAVTVRDALLNAIATCPALQHMVQANGQLAAHWLLSLNGERFLDDLSEPLNDGARLLVLSADAGG